MEPLLTDECRPSACQLCQVMVTSRQAHEASARHRAARQLAAAALGRLRAHLHPQAKADTSATVTPLALDSDGVVFCGSCTSPVPSLEKNHSRCKTHLVAALDEQLLDELVREYVEEEDLVYMEAPSKDPSCVETEEMVEYVDTLDKYKCYLCDVHIPTIFRSEHECSLRHRANVACANAAARRIGAYLTPVDTVFPLETDTDDKITPLLKVYVKSDAKEPQTLGKGEETTKKIKVTATVQKRLTAKKYFTEVQRHLDEIGEFCTLILDDTEYVTVKSGKNTLRVHVANFNGVYNVEDEMKCRMCDFNNFHESYSSESQQDMYHVMSLGHISQVLTPIDNVHGIRKIDNMHFFCIICNVFLPSYNVAKSHIVTDIQHTALLPEALKRGKNFKESKDDLKIIIYGPPPNYGITKQYTNFPFGTNNITPQTFNASLFATTPKFGIPNQIEEKAGLFSQTGGYTHNNNQASMFGTTNQTSQNAFGTPKTNVQLNQSTFGSAANSTQPGQIFGTASQTANASLSSFGTHGTGLSFGTNQTVLSPNQNSFTTKGTGPYQNVFGAANQTNVPSDQINFGNVHQSPGSGSGNK